MANTLNLGTDGNWAVKKDSLLAYNDENNNFKPLPFDFTRASSATVVNKAGLIETVGSGEPRIDFLGNTKGALLLEPQRTNLITYSEGLSNWTNLDGASVSDNSIISPDGTQNASEITFNTSGKRLVFTVSSTQAIYSAYFKGVSGTQIKLRDGSGAIFNTITLTNEWVRYELNINASNSNVQIQSVDADYVYAWGVQLEQGSYATSYIPTQGSIVTRLADVCSQTPPDGVIGQTEGTVFVDATNLLTSGSRTIFLLYTSGSAFYQIYINSSNQVRADVNGTFIFLGGSVLANTNYKIAFAYKSGEYALYINGTQIATSTITTIPSSLTDYYLGSSIAGEQSGAYSQNKLYNTALTDSELQALTTI